MAKVYGVELKNVIIDSGFENYRAQATIYLDGIEVGFFLDDGNGGTSIIKFSCDINIKSRFYYVAWRYFASYPDIDSSALLEFTQKEFIEYKSNLPKIDYKEWPDEKVAVFFVEKLLYLFQIEEQYSMATSEGYVAIAVVRFFTLKNVKAEPDRIFYFDNSAEQLNEIIAQLGNKSLNYIIRTYSCEADFDIR